MAFKFPDKDPDEKLDYTVDWSRYLSTDDVIYSAGSSWKIQKSDGSYTPFTFDQTFQNDVVVESVTDTRTARVNASSGINNSTSLVLDSNVGTIKVGQRITGTGITGNVYVTAVTSQTNITVSEAVTLANDTLLTFTTHGLSMTSETYDNPKKSTIVLSKGLANTNYRLLCEIQVNDDSGIVTNREINLRVRERS